MNTIISKIKNWILRFIQGQLIVSLISLSILVNWGLPISILSPLGNILFTPLCMIFLLLSSALFFFEILYIPNTFLAYLLEKTSFIWLYCMPSNNYSPFVGFAKPHILFTIIVPILTFIILFCKKISNISINIFFLSLLLVTSMVYLTWIQAPKDFVTQISCNNGNITLIYSQGKTTVIDPGFIGARISAISWIEYTLTCEIIKSCGKIYIDNLILMAPGKLLFEAVENLCKSMYIKNLYLVCWQGQLQKNILRSFYFMKKAAIANNTNIIRIFTKKHITLSDQAKIEISPLDTKLSYNTATYPALCVTYMIDNKEVKIYSAKYKGKQIKQGERK